MEWLNSIVRTPQGRVIGGISAALICVAVYFEVKSIFGSSAPSSMLTLTYIDSATGKAFPHELSAGESIPVMAPSGQKTGYPAEFCFWNKDGTIKGTPTPVLINGWIGKSGPTFCPDCGRLVIMRNPAPTAGSRPPPTKEEYERIHASAGN